MSSGAATSGQAPLADGAGGVAYGTVGAVGAAAALKLLTRTFTATEIKALTDAAPLEILPAVAKTFHAAYSWGTYFSATATQYTNGADLVMSTGPTANGWWEYIARDTNLHGAVDYSDFTGNGGVMTWYNQYATVGADVTEVFGQNLRLALDPAGAPNTPYAVGTGTLTLYLLYSDIVTP